MTKRKLSKLFREAPRQWGLRGDPYLWEEMASELTSTDLPETSDALEAILCITYERLVGVRLADEEHIYVERYAHGGMSSGKISPRFWKETAIPLLLKQLDRLHTPVKANSKLHEWHL